MEWGLVPEAEENDMVFEQHGIQVVVNKEDASILNGTIIDYKESMMGGGFTIDNPNAIASCGCGSSFRTATALEHQRIVNIRNKIKAVPDI